jgi:hypothetical protein
MTNNTNNASSFASFDTFDNTTSTLYQAANDTWSVMVSPNTSINHRVGISTIVTGMTVGHNFQFTMKYKAGAGTASFLWRTIAVIPF